ncbi:hypothetical protein BDR04DRAFT_1158869 [Suillus decipiens]|nr:hypothetical protein BDR04DRAFT_1158869 [Suillus decipiens]
MKETADSQEQAANTCTALRMTLGAGMDKFVNPDSHGEYVELVWHGQFGLEDSKLNLLDVDWLVECTNHFNTAQEFDAAGDAFLLLSNLKDIKQEFIVPFLNNSPRLPTLRHCTLHAACWAIDINLPCDSSFAQAVLTAISPPIQCGHSSSDLFANAICLLKLTDWPKYDLLFLEGSLLIDIQHLTFLVLLSPSLDNPVEFYQYCHALIHFMNLAMITDTPSLDVPVSLWTMLSQALLTMVPSEFDPLDDFYFCLIFTLASCPIWLPHLVKDGHIRRCIDIIPVFCDQPPSSFFYLCGIFLHTQVTYGQQSTLLITPSQWWDLTRMAWHVTGHWDHNNSSDSDVLDDSDCVDILEALVTTMKSHIPQDISKNDLEFLHGGLGDTICKLEVQDVPSKAIIDAIIDAITELKRSFEPTS